MGNFIANIYILPDVARGAYFHGKVFFFAMKCRSKSTHHSTLRFLFLTCSKYKSIGHWR